MAPVSIIPGRIRFEEPTLIGRAARCRALEQLFSAWPEINEVTVNQRTGRILIRFDEKETCRDILLDKIATYRRQDFSKLRDSSTPVQDVPNSSLPKLRSSNRFLREILVHAVLPAPLDFIVPTALTAFRK